LPGYLWVIPLMVLLFSYLYCVSALVAVYYRSTLVCVLMSLGAWVMFFGIQSADDVMEMGGLRVLIYGTPPTTAPGSINRVANPGGFHKIVRLARWITPKTQDITYKARQWCRGAQVSELVPVPGSESEQQQMAGLTERVEVLRLQIPAWQTFGSSLLFEVVVVAIAIWKFNRTDF
jgi:hypothetical protein